MDEGNAEGPEVEDHVLLACLVEFRKLQAFLSAHILMIKGEKGGEAGYIEARDEDNFRAPLEAKLAS